MWKISRGEHVLWILGTLKPVPASITWESAAALEVIADAELALWEPSFTLDVEAGFLKKLSLGYSYMKARNNPDGQRLKDILPPDVHARWERLRDRHLSDRGNFERKRPIFVSEQLLTAALAERGLSNKAVVGPVVIHALKSNGTRLQSPRHTLKLSSNIAAEMLKAVRESSINDSACLIATMDLVETGMDRLVSNANAWAVGEVERIDLSLMAKRDQLCTSSLSDFPAARQHGIPDIRAVMREEWITAADAALRTHRTTVAVIPIADLIADDGYINALRRLGYEIDSPL